MPKPRTGSIKKMAGQFVARVRFIDPNTGERRALVAKRETWRDADKELKKLIDRAAKLEAGEAYKGSTFAELAVHYKETYAIPPVWRDGKIVQGIASWKERRRIVERDLEPRFGHTPIADFTPSLIRQFQGELFEKPVMGKSEATKDTVIRERSAISVNRIMEVLRHMFNVAIDDEWIAPPGPFRKSKGKKSLIRKSLENRRKRICSVEEERLILKHMAADNRRAHWIPRVIAAIDAGMRRGEIDICEWRQVHFEMNAILVIEPKDAQHARKAESIEGEDRIVVMTNRLRTTLLELQALAQAKGACEPTARVFPQLHSTANRAWRTACRLAGVTGLQFRDLRHTTASRLNARGFSLASIARILGHEAPSMTWTYTNIDLSMQQEAARALEDFRELQHSAN